MKKLSVLSLVTTIYVVFIVLWMAARLLIFDQFWLLAMLNTVAEYLFAPLPILFFISIWKHNKISLAELCIPLLLFVLMFGRLFWPPPSNERADDKKAIALMSFNVLHSNTAYAAIVDSIQSANPDVIGFQELTPAIAAFIVEKLESVYPYNTFQYLETGLTTAVLSKFPIESAERFDLPPLDRALHTVVQVEGTKAHIIVVHLSPNNFFEPSTAAFVTLVKERYGRRESETMRLAQMIQDLDGPVLLMCDCNLTDTSEAYARLDTVLDDSFSEAGWGMGHTFQPPQVSFPIQRIDYVWHTEEFQAVYAYIGQDGGSDHLPLVAKLRFSR
jgi:endonuclease/exonuclease/phosphatase (EEP) superfamily protein YafD